MSDDRTRKDASPREGVCPECAHEIRIAEFDVDRGEIFACPECGVELELLGFAPLRLVRAQPEE